MVRRAITKRVGEILLERGIITHAQLQASLAHQKQHGGMLGEILIESGLVTEQEIALALTAQYGFPYLPLDNYEIEDGVTKLIPEPVARQYCLIPVDKIGTALTVAMADPSNVQAIDDIEMLTNCVVQTFVSTPSDIRKAIDRYYRAHEGPAANGTPASA
jgi:type IV pilus assembly protein PilB